LRYFFCVLKDEEEQTFSSLDDAEASAMVIASELVGDETFRGGRRRSGRGDLGVKLSKRSLAGPTVLSALG
jgi:hypothetical protein